MLFNLPPTAALRSALPLGNEHNTRILSQFFHQHQIQFIKPQCYLSQKKCSSRLCFGVIYKLHDMSNWIPKLVSLSLYPLPLPYISELRIKKKKEKEKTERGPGRNQLLRPILSLHIIQNSSYCSLTDFQRDLNKALLLKVKHRLVLDRREIYKRTHQKRSLRGMQTGAWKQYQPPVLFKISSPINCGDSRWIIPVSSQCREWGSQGT